MASAMGEWRARKAPAGGGRPRRRDLSPRAGALSTWRWSHGSRHGLFSVALPGWNGVCKYSLRVDLLDFRPIPQSPHFCVAHPIVPREGARRALD